MERFHCSQSPHAFPTLLQYRNDKWEFWTFSGIKTSVKVVCFSRFSESRAGSIFLYKTDFSAETFSFLLLCHCLFSLAISAFCYGLSACCTHVCKSPCFQREASLCFTLVRNEKCNCYRRCIDKSCPGVKVKNSAFKPLAHFSGQNCWIWIWSNQILLFLVLLQPLLSVLSILFIHTFGKY